jgi:transcriptional regulator with XRE-family HTH domain
MPPSTDNDPNLTRFGTVVRARRRGLGMSQEKLARAADLHRNYVGGIERGERNVALKNILRLAAALGLTPSALFALFEAQS